MEIKEKPDSVSWEEIHKILWTAHTANRENGIQMQYASLSVRDLKEKFEGNAKIYVAIENDIIVGCSAIQVRNCSLWCGSGKYAYLCLAAVLPNYQGRGVYQALFEKRIEEVFRLKLDRVVFDTHEYNRRMISIAENNGFRKVALRKYGDHYSVVMVKWLIDSPYSAFYCNLRYILSSFHIRLKSKNLIK